MANTYIRTKGEKKTYERSIFDVDEKESRLKVYVKSSLKIYDVVVGKACLEREEFCAGKFTFSVVKDDVISFNQGDAVSVKFDGEGIFYGYVFSKERDKRGIIEVVCYDQMRYLKNKSTYTRGRMNIGEVVRKVSEECGLSIGELAGCNVLLNPVCAQNISLLDVVKKACSDVRTISGKRFILYDDCGFLTLKDEEDMVLDILIDSSDAGNFFYKDSIDNNVYNTVSLYTDTKRINLRDVVNVYDKDSVRAWGTLSLSKKAEDGENALEEAKNLLAQYNRVNREIVLDKLCGDTRLSPGCRVYVDMEMGDLDIDRYMRVKKALHFFENNIYFVKLYLDGSCFDEYR